MASPARTPPPEPAAEAQAPPPPPPSQLPTVDPSRLSPDNPAPAPLPPAAAPTTTAPPPRRTGDSSPPSPPKAPTPPPLFTTDPSPPLPRQSQTSAPRPPSPPAPAPAPTPPPPPPPASPQAKSEPDADEATSESPASPQAKSEQEADEATSESPASPEAKSEQEADEAAGESENMTLALALTQTEETVPPPKEAAAAESPDGSPQKESDLTIAKLLSGEDPAATEAKPGVDKVAPAVVTGSVSPAGGGGGRGFVGSKRWLLGGVPEKVRRTELKKAELGFRVSAAVFCLVSLSVMAADTTPGWSGDSFRRYNEYRYTLAASVMAFTYSGFQLVAEVHYLVNGRHIIRGPWDKYFNLAMDQILAYLVLSASSAALSRNDVWVSRFGVDQFAKRINASASMAFLAFIALGLSSIISAYHVFSSIS